MATRLVSALLLLLALSSVAFGANLLHFRRHGHRHRHGHHVSHQDLPMQLDATLPTSYTGVRAGFTRFDVVNVKTLDQPSNQIISVPKVTFTEKTLKTAAKQAVEFPGIPSEFENAEWETAKVVGGDYLIELGRFRAMHVPGQLKEVKDTCPTCKCEKVGSNNPESDLDIGCNGPQANAMVKAFNKVYETRWGKPSANVFDTNIYGITWALPTATPVVGADSTASKNVDEGAAKDGWGSTQPVCFSAGKAVDTKRSLVKDTTKKDAWVFGPSGKTAQLRLFEVPASPTQINMGALTSAQMLDTAQKADPFADPVRHQHVFALMKVIYFAQELGQYKYALQPELKKACSIKGLFSTDEKAYLDCPILADMVDGIGKEMAAIGGKSKDSIVTGKVINGALMFEHDMVIAAKKLMKLSCSTDNCQSFIEKPSDPSKLLDTDFVNMEDVASRNRKYEAYLDQMYAVLNPKAQTTPGGADATTCLNLQTTISESLFYAMEAYYTKGAFNHIVSGVDQSADDYFDSMLENFADIVKDTSHAYAHGWDVDRYTVQASKYMQRFLDASVRFIDKFTTSDEKDVLDVDEFFMDRSRCTSDFSDQLKSDVRGKQSVSLLRPAKFDALSTMDKCFGFNCKGGDKTNCVPTTSKDDASSLIDITIARVFSQMEKLFIHIVSFYYANVFFAPGQHTMQIDYGNDNAEDPDLYLGEFFAGDDDEGTPKDMQSYFQ